MTGINEAPSLDAIYVSRRCAWVCAFRAIRRRYDYFGTLVAASSEEFAGRSQTKKLI
jgi:hypothetical protein